MSNTVTPTATESGEVQAVQNHQVLCTIGSCTDQWINATDALVVQGASGEHYVIHKVDTSLYLTIEGVCYMSNAVTYCNIGSYRGQHIPKVHAIELYSGSIIHKCDIDIVLITAYTNRKFVRSEMESERIVPLCEHEEEEGDIEYEYQANCTRIYRERGYFWQFDNFVNQYLYSAETARYYENEAAAEAHGLVYDDQEDEWVSEDTYNGRYNEDGYSDHHNTANYHYFTRRSRKDEQHCGFSIGYEIEKEDREVKVEICMNKLYDNLGWCKEQDGSLDTKSGFEAVSPVYSLFGKQLELDLKNEDLQRIVNAEYNEDTCGGHINISSDTFTKEELYEGISAFFPLLYCIYEKRIHETYCQAKKKSEMSAKRDKYSAIYIRDNRVEIRIFPAVKNVENLLWRRDLIRIMVKNINATELQVFKMMMNKKSKLHRHLSRVMSAEKIHQKCVKFLEYSKAFNDKNIDKNGNNLLNK